MDVSIRPIHTEGKGMQFEFYKTNRVKEHIHADVELLYVFKGTANVSVGSENHLLAQDDFLIINRHQLHSHMGSNNALIGGFHVSTDLLWELMRQRDLTFWCNSTIDKSSAYAEIRQAVRDMARDSLESSGVGNIRLMGAYYRILYLMTKHFLVQTMDESTQDPASDAERIAVITEYVETRYQDKISLSELAESLFLSEAYLSRFISKRLGVRFLEYVNQVRLRHAEADLMKHPFSVTRIAIENGFPNVSAFERVFKDKHGISPKMYRMRMKETEKAVDSSPTDTALKSRVEAYVSKLPDAPEALPSQELCIEVKNIPDAKPYENAWRRMINVGTAADLLRSNLQEHVLDIKRRLRFEYVRVWDLYAPEMYIDINSIHHHYNFDKLNRVLDFLVGNGLTPYLELNIKPKKLLQNVRKMLIADDSTLAFDSMEHVRSFMEALILHLIDRYNTEQLNRWCFEVWQKEGTGSRTPDGEAEDTPEAYVALFRVIAETIRKHLPETKIGGAGLSIRYGRKLLKETLEAWRKSQQQPDFLTFYCYPYVLGEIDDQKVNKTSTDQHYFSNYLEMARDVMTETGFQSTPLHVTEWNSTVSNRNVLNDSCAKGAYVMKSLIDTIGMADLIGYWFASDVFADFYDSNELLNGSSGLLSKDGIPKPAYYAFEFMNRLGPKLLDRGPGYMVTDTGYNEVRIACHNYKFFNYRYFLMYEDELELQKMNQVFEDLESKTLTFQLHLANPGHYEVKIHAVNQHYGSVQDEWIRMSRPGNLIQEDIQYLKQVCVPRISIMLLQTEGNRLSFTTTLEANEIQMIQVRFKNK